MIDLEQHVEETPRALAPHVLATRIRGEERAHVQLIEHDLVERWRPKARVVPWIVARLRDDAVAVGERGSPRQLTRERIALVARRALPFDEELVLVARLDAGNEPRPERSRSRQRLISPPVEAAAHADAARGRIPDAECRARLREVRAHRR